MSIIIIDMPMFKRPPVKQCTDGHEMKSAQVQCYAEVRLCIRVVHKAGGGSNCPGYRR